jgi:phage FluMu protein Com
MTNKGGSGVLDEKVLEKYSIALKDAEEVLSGTKEPLDRPPTWTADERKRWLVREPECPLCKQKYTDSNKITKEHIHPLCLGGKESAHNITALCDQCNQSRNDMMSRVLAFKKVTELRKRWPANRTSVQEFIVWCHATIFEDISVIRSFPHINEAFSITRNIDYPGESDYEDAPKDKRKITIRTLKSSVSSKMKSITKGFRKNKAVLSQKVEVGCEKCPQILRIPKDYSGEYRCPKCKFVNKQTPNQSKTKTQKDSPPSDASGDVLKSTSFEQDILPIDEFKKIILELMPNEQIALGLLASKVSAYMTSKNYEKTTTTAFLKLFGLPRGFKKALITHLDSEIDISGTATNPTIQRIKSNKGRNSGITVEAKDDNIKTVKAQVDIDDIKIESTSKISTKAPDNMKLEEMKIRILTKDVSHLLFSTLSHKKMEAGVLGVKMNYRLREESLIPKEDLFYSFYGLSKKDGLVKLIKSEFSKEIICSQDHDNANRWYVELNQTVHVASLKNELERMGRENNGRVELIQFWVEMNKYLENNSMTRGDFQRQLGIPNKGTIQEKVWRIIERLDVPYSLEGFMIEGESPTIVLHDNQS